jgi:hypothetical protein
MTLGRRVDLEGDLAAFTEIGKSGSEQFSGRLDERYVHLPCEVDGDTGSRRACCADTLRESCGQETRREELIPESGVRQRGR